MSKPFLQKMFGNALVYQLSTETVFRGFVEGDIYSGIMLFIKFLQRLSEYIIKEIMRVRTLAGLPVGKDKLFWENMLGQQLHGFRKDEVVAHLLCLCPFNQLSRGKCPLISDDIISNAVPLERTCFTGPAALVKKKSEDRPVLRINTIQQFFLNFSAYCLRLVFRNLYLRHDRRFVDDPLPWAVDS